MLGYPYNLPLALLWLDYLAQTGHMRRISSLVRNILATSIIGGLLSVGMTPIAATAAPCLLSGSGTSQSPYQVGTATNFQDIPNCDGPNKHFLQTTSLSFSFNPITPFDFYGIYDGNNNYISDFSVNLLGATTDVLRSNAGLFSTLWPGSEIKNLKLGGYIVVTGFDNVGSLAGQSFSSRISNVTSEATTITATGAGAGGLIGQSNDTQLDHVKVMDMNVIGQNYVGGIVGIYNAGNVSTLTELVTAANLAVPSLTADRDAFLGGMFGLLAHDLDLSIVDSAVFSGNASFAVSNSYDYVVGGIAGQHLMTAVGQSKTLSMDRVAIDQYLELTAPENLQIGMVIGESATTNPQSQLTLDLDGIVTMVACCDSGDDERGFVVSPTTNPKSGSSVIELLTDVVYAPSEHLPVTRVVPGAYALPDARLINWTSTWEDLGWDISDVTDHEDIQNNNLVTDWYMAPSTFISILPFALIDDLGVDLSTRFSPLGASTPISFTAQGQSWVDVPIADRVYLEAFPAYSGTDIDDAALTYVAAGTDCASPLQRVDGDAYPNGYFIPTFFDSFSSRFEFQCQNAQGPVFFQEGESVSPGFDIGFDFGIGSGVFDQAFLSTNGNLSFEYGVVGYDEPLSFLGRNTNSPLISALMVDQEYEVGVSSIWAARTTVNGQPAAVFSWENMAIYPTNDSRPRNENASHQVVLIQNSSDQVEMWFNYEQVRVVPGHSAGMVSHTLMLDLKSGVTPGTNEVTTAPARFNTLGTCLEFRRSNLIVADEITDAAVRSFVDGNANRVFIKLLDQQTHSAQLFSDSNCNTPFVISEKQDTQADGHAVIGLIQDSGEQDDFALPIGYVSVPNEANKDVVLEEMFLNVSMAELIDGGVNELISIMDGSNVPGRIVRNFTIQRPAASVVAMPYSGPVITSTTIAAAPGTLVTLAGSGLASVSQILVGDMVITPHSKSETSLSFTLPLDAKAGLKDVVLTSSFGEIRVGSLIDVVAGKVDRLATVAPSIKRIDDSVRMFVTDLIGAGKVQFRVNGREIGWIRAVDETDPKLFEANGTTYFVRRVALVPGKNIIEILLNGERIRRVAYTL